MASGKSTVSDLLAKSIEKCVHLRGDVFRKMIISGRENMSATPSAEAVRQLYLRYKLTADAARSYFDNGFSVVIQDNYYGDELNRMINYLHKYPVEVVVLCPDVETIKERERYREKTGYSGFTVETLYDTFMQTTPRIGFWLDNSNQTPQQTVETMSAAMTRTRPADRTLRFIILLLARWTCPNNRPTYPTQCASAG